MPLTTVVIIADSFHSRFLERDGLRGSSRRFSKADLPLQDQDHATTVSL